jgi:membrane-bound lytic murein transglycosylase D
MPGRGRGWTLLLNLACLAWLAASARAGGVWWLDSLSTRRPLPVDSHEPAPPPRLPPTPEEAEALLCRFAPDLPVYVDSCVLRLAAWYGGPDWTRWQMWRRGARPLLEAAEADCRLLGLPEALALLPLALSGGDPAAGTPLGQAGPWRLDLATARRAGLRVDDRLDQRRDPARATRAALDRMNDLRVRHGDDGSRALTAFACGPANLTRALALGGEDLPGLAARVEPPEREILPLYMAFLLLEALTPEARAWPALAFPDSPPVDVPPPGAQAAPQAADEPPRSILVRRGDTLEGLARRHGVRISQLRRANGLSGDRIQAGQRLRLPGGGKKDDGDYDGAKVERLTGQQGKTTFRTYTVRSGDTLSGIAARHPGVSVRDLMEANQITDRIQPGQRIRIPLP